MLARLLAILLLVVQPLAAIVVELRLLGAPRHAPVCCCCLVVRGEIVECRTVPGPDQRPGNCCRVDIAAVAPSRPGLARPERTPEPDRSPLRARLAFEPVPGISYPAAQSEASGVGRARLCIWII